MKNKNKNKAEDENETKKSIILADKKEEALDANKLENPNIQKELEVEKEKQKKLPKKKKDWSILLLLFIIFPLVAYLWLGFQNLTKFETADEHLWINNPYEGRIHQYWDAMSQKDWSQTRINDKPGVSLAYISGLGLLGQLAGRLAKAAGCRVFGVDLSEHRLKLAECFDAAVPRDKAEQAAAAFTRGLGFDCVLICADGATNDPIELSAALARDRGIVVAVGNVTLNVPRTAFYRKELTLKVSRSYGPGR